MPENDPGISKFGVIIRKYSLDELPQLINAVKREMALVGPRMISPEEVTMDMQFDMNLLQCCQG
jgi:lipopolysaccharide/colanic/teichoic acid biosynthesis glycosyltransferase